MSPRDFCSYRTTPSATARIRWREPSRVPANEPGCTTSPTAARERERDSAQAWSAYDADLDQRFGLGRTIGARPVPPQLHALERIMKQIIAETTAGQLAPH
jgi:hypothetical protein